jgi:hypothetical protein
MDELGCPLVQRTEHGMMVVWGYFSRVLHLAERLRQKVLMPRHHENIPAADLILEFGLLLLSGSTQLQDLNQGPRPLTKDEVVREAWDLQWGHCTSVSRILKVATAEPVAEVVAVLDNISQPFIEQEVAAVALRGQGLLLYADLSGRPVSAYSESYPEARWGHMGNSLALGHQHAVISLQGRAYRIQLAGFLHPGDVVSQHCVRELIQAAERRLGCRPRRRVELVAERSAALKRLVHDHRLDQTQQGQLWQAEKDCQQALTQRLAEQDEEITDLEAKQGDKPVRPYSNLAKARRQRESWQRQLERSRRREEEIRAKIGRFQEKIDRLVQEKEQVDTWQATLLADNAANPNPVSIRILLDGGFSGGEDLAYLIEMGYDLLTVGKGKSAVAFRQEMPPEPTWIEATPHVQLWEGPPALVGECPYPLRRILQHWHAGEKERDSLFLQYPVASTRSPAQVFADYHQRQHAEAGIKQGKGVFGGRGLRIRSAAGLELLNQFAFVFWPNFVHWATDWLEPRVRQNNTAFDAALRTVKTQVRVGAQTSATLVRAPGSRVLIFSSEGPYADVHLQLDGVYAFQPHLPLFRCSDSTPDVPLPPRRLLSPPAG